MDGVNGQSVPERRGGRLGEWVGWGGPGAEIKIRRVRSVRLRTGWEAAEAWIRRWPLIAVGVALLAGVIMGLRSEEG